MSMMFYLLDQEGEVDRLASAQIRDAFYRPAGTPPIVPKDANVPLLRRIWGFRDTVLSPEEVKQLRDELEVVRPRFTAYAERAGEDVKSVIALCERAIAESRSMDVGGP
jgi:hypothetical protein